MKNKISAVIITKNEELNIERCLKSITWVDEILIVDSYSEDKTIEICKKYNCRVIQTAWQGFGKTKKYAVDNASNNWILSIDADEEMTGPLQEKIEILLDNPLYNAYNIKRRSFYLGKEIKHCGWDNDYPLRLFNRRYGNFNDKEVHESVEIKGEKLKINKTLLHYTYPTVSSHIEKMNLYSDLALQNNNETNDYSIVMSLALGLNKFLKMYLLQRGFLDGRVGFLLSLNSAFGVYLKYLKVWQRKS